jgi:NAD dependent epimerase/dehydratase family enzyme
MQHHRLIHAMRASLGLWIRCCAPLRIAFGPFAEELLLSGQRVMPLVGLKSGFRFTDPAIDDALASIVGKAQVPCVTSLLDREKGCTVTGFLHGQ